MKTAKILVLTLALAAGGGAAYLASTTAEAPLPPPAPVAQKTVEVLVAAKDLDPGATLTPPDMKWQPWLEESAGPGQIRRDANPKAMEDFAGAFVRNSIVAGEPLRDGKLIRAGGYGYMAAMIQSGMRAVATEISPENGAGGFVLPNDRVDVILTRSEKSGRNAEQFSSETILTDVRVLAIDQTVKEKDGQKAVPGKIATLELTPKQSETLALARRLGTVSLSLKSLVDRKERPGTERDLNDNSQAVNIIRYGVSTMTMAR